MNFIGLTLLILFTQIYAFKSNLRSVGGRDALKGEFPFILRIELLYDEIFSLKLCSASALTPTWGLTAAHCCPGINFILDNNSTVVVRYNNVFPNNWGKTSDVIRCIPHPGYNPLLSLHHHDVALLKTQTMEANGYAKLSSLQPTSIIGSEGFVAGYGDTNVSGRPPPLQVTEGMFAKCANLFNVISRNSLCLRATCNVVAACTHGDSGGPAVHKSGVVGVISLSTHEFDAQRNKLYEMSGDKTACIVQVIDVHLKWIASVLEHDKQ